MPSKQNNPQQTNKAFDMQVKNIMRKVARALKQGDNTEAARLFIEGHKGLVMPADVELPAYLAKTFGIDVTSKLLKAFVSFPCGYCKNGHETCPDCGARGYLEDYIICESCAGLGVSRCIFCNGSGLAATDSVPLGLRPIVVIERATIALEQVKKFLEQPISRPSPTRPSNSRKANARLLLELNRFMGILENTLVTAKELVNGMDKAKDKITKIACLCVKAAFKCESQMQETIKWMAEAARLETETPNQDQEICKLASKRADYYTALCKSSDTFAGTCLDHPFMNEAIKKMFGKTAKAGDQ